MKQPATIKMEFWLGVFLPAINLAFAVFDFYHHNIFAMCVNLFAVTFNIWRHPFWARLFVRSLLGIY